MESVKKGYGAQEVLVEVSFSLAWGDRMGVVGPNGAGKTTMLALAAGRLSPDDGRVFTAAGSKVGYLLQEEEVELDSGTPVYVLAAAALGHVFDLERRLEETETRLASTTSEAGARPILKDYDELRAAYERLGGYASRARVEAALFGVGFGREEFSLPGGALSGGQRVRLALARLFLGEHQILLLDEPTNHLDVAGMEWLEAALASFPGAVLMVSHDRYFLDRSASKILELRNGRAQVFPGNYTAYRQQRDQLDRDQASAHARQAKTVEKLEDYIRRYRAGNRATMAKSRQQALQRLDLVEPPETAEGPRIALDPKSRGGREVLRLQDLACRFPGRELLSGLDLTVYRGERLLLLGRNGTGKSTFLKTLAGLRAPDAGSVRVGGGVHPTYLSQDGSELPAGFRVLDTITACGLDPGPARDVLARVGLVGEDVFKSVADLSGGERSRLLLARLMLSGANLLLLDEPTNHLDVTARAALEEALAGFSGTLVFATHDRYLMDKLATRLLVFHGKWVEPFGGNYSAYREKLRRGEAETRAEAPPKAPPARRVSRPRVREEQERPGVLEERVSTLEKEKASLEEELAEPGLYRSPAAREVAERYRQLLLLLDEAYALWAKALEEGVE
jgi:ATP-binding cassette subfamily F protein 3